MIIIKMLQKQKVRKYLNWNNGWHWLAACLTSLPAQKYHELAKKYLKSVKSAKNISEREKEGKIELCLGMLVNPISIHQSVFVWLGLEKQPSKGHLAKRH